MLNNNIYLKVHDYNFPFDMLLYSNNNKGNNLGEMKFLTRLLKNKMKQIINLKK